MKSFGCDVKEIVPFRWTLSVVLILCVTVDDDDADSRAWRV